MVLEYHNGTMVLGSTMGYHWYHGTMVPYQWYIYMVYHTSGTIGTIPMVLVPFWYHTGTHVYLVPFSTMVYVLLPMKSVRITRSHGNFWLL
jgi:hypothetical protein